MKVGVLCEESGVVRDAFAERGHDAWSCDILPRPGKHICGDCLAQDWSGFDLLICFPPCTYLCSSGLHRNKGNPKRQAKSAEAEAFVLRLWELPVNKIGIENPIGRLTRVLGAPSQIIQPFMFGHDASKATCLWLRGLPKLIGTEEVAPRYVNGLPRWANQTNSGQNREPPGPMRARRRSKTYPGIAAAMAEQWGNL